MITSRLILTAAFAAVLSIGAADAQYPAPSSSVTAAPVFLINPATGMPATAAASGGTASSVAVTALPPLPSGTNAIGTVGVTALPSLPAGTNAIGTVTEIPGSRTPVALTTGTVATAGTAVTALTGTQHARGGWIRNCNASGTLFVNDAGAASQTEAGSNAALMAGTGGSGQAYQVAPGTTTISVTGSAAGMTICGEGYN